MATGPHIGNGTTITFADFTAPLTNISRTVGTRVAVDASHLGTTGFSTMLASTRTTPGTITADILLDPSLVTEFESVATAAATTLTLTYPLAGGTTAAKMTNNAFVTDLSQTWGDEEMMGGSITWQLDGGNTSHTVGA